MKIKEAKIRENHRFSARKNSKGIFCTQKLQSNFSRFAKFSRKSQAALEFLMTYGWVIMVALVAIGALSYFGVLSPDNFLPNKCTLPPGIACVDFEVKDIIGPGAGEVYIVVKNSLGYDITNAGITASDCTDGTTEPLIRNGANSVALTAIGCTLTSGAKYSGEINITYTNSDTNLQHKSIGTLVVRPASGNI